MRAVRSFIPLLALMGVAVFSQAEELSDVYVHALGAPERPASDRGRDKSRHPVEILTFADIRPGMTVIELGAGGGYTTEVVARVAGPDGRVIAQGLDGARTGGGRLPNVTGLDKHLLWETRVKVNEAGVADGQADRVLIFFALHDMYLNDRIDKQGLLGDLRALLKPGGLLVILDNAAPADSGLRYTAGTHRIGEQFVRDEVERAGFRFAGETDVLRNPDDNPTEHWSRPAPYRQPGLQDRFALRFVSP